MAISVNEIFHKVGLNPKGPVKWNGEIEEKSSGVYLIALTDDPSSNESIAVDFGIDEMVFKDWLDKKTGLKICENEVKKLQEIEKYLLSKWHPNQNILYIGETKTNLRTRIKSFYNYKVGNSGPHSGGYWLKLLSCLENTFIYYAKSDLSRETEFKMLLHFIELLSDNNLYDISEPAKYLPFANLKVDVTKLNDIKKAFKRKKVI